MRVARGFFLVVFQKEFCFLWFVTNEKPRNMRKLWLESIKIGHPGISETGAPFLIEAAKICLELNGHLPGVALKITGEYEEEIQLFWKSGITQQQIKAWGDKVEAVEYAATCISVLLISALTEFAVEERLGQTDLGDYLLETHAGNLKTAILEVSGIFKENRGNTIEARISKKEKTIENKRHLNRKDLIFTIVTEFGAPKSKIKKI